MSYSVGQVIYIVLNKRQTVVPAQVVEETVRRTLEGELVTYSVLVPNKSKSIYALDELDGDVYVSLDDVRDKLMNNAKKVIDELINAASGTADAAFAVMDPFGGQHAPSPIKSTPSSDVQVTLEDGTVANVKLPKPGSA